MTDAPDELWRLVLAFMLKHGSTREPTGRDRARVDELLAELYILRERPTVDDLRAALAELGARERWAKEVTSRWRKRLKRPTWRPRELRERSSAWVRPFVVPEQLVSEHGLRPIPDRLTDALTAAADEYVRLSAAEPASAGTSDEAAVFALTGGAVRLWALSRDAVEGLGWPSVLSCALVGKDNLARHWTNAGRARERERIERYRAEVSARFSQQDDST